MSEAITVWPTMTPMGFVSLDIFHGHKLRPGETLSVFVHELKKLLDQAMPSLDVDACDQLVLHQFLGGIPPPPSAAESYRRNEHSRGRRRMSPFTPGTRLRCPDSGCNFSHDQQRFQGTAGPSGHAHYSDK